VAVLALVSSADAAFFGFTRITSNSSQDVAAQLFVDVTDPGGGQVDFTFYNLGTIPGSIADIYFDDNEADLNLLGIASITDSGTNVDFTNPATPGNLPGGNLASPPFVTTGAFSANSTNPITENGVNNALDLTTEWVTITFNLTAGTSFADVLAAIAAGELRMGLHVQGIGTDGNSDGFVNTPGELPSQPCLFQNRRRSSPGSSVRAVWVSFFAAG
jgi:hypothetical protein